MQIANWISHKLGNHTATKTIVTKADKWCQHKKTCHSTPEQPYGHIVAVEIPSDDTYIDFNGYIVRTKKKGKMLLLQVIPADWHPHYAIRVKAKHVNGIGDQRMFKVLNIRNYSKG